MMRIIFLPLFLLSLFSFSQVHIEYWENGTIKVKGNYNEGKRDGYWQEFYSNGVLKLEGKYKLDELDSTWKYYCKHGFPERETYWENKKCKRIINYFITGAPRLYVEFKEGLNKQDYIHFYRINEQELEYQKKLYVTSGYDLPAIHTGVVYSMLTFGAPTFASVMANNRGKVLADNLNASETRRNSTIKKLCKSLKQETVYLLMLGQRPLEFANYHHGEDNVEIYYEHYEVEPYNRYKEEIYINGQLKTTINFHNPKYEYYQECMRYYDNDQLESKGSYRKGVMIKDWFYYSYEGDFIRREIYDKEGKLKKVKYPKYFVPLY